LVKDNSIRLKEKDIRDFLIAWFAGMRVKITFREDSIDDVNYLIGMIDGKIIKVSRGDYATLLAISSDKTWGSESNRTVELELAKTFNLDWFVDRMAYRLEKIEMPLFQKGDEIILNEEGDAEEWIKEKLRGKTYVVGETSWVCQEEECGVRGYSEEGVCLDCGKRADQSILIGDSFYHHSFFTLVNKMAAEA